MSGWEPPHNPFGPPFGATHKSMVVWKGVEERPRKMFTCWKRYYLSKGVMITLIRSTLSIYHMSLVRMPKTMVNRLEKIQTDFFCGEGEP